MGISPDQLNKVNQSKEDKAKLEKALQDKINEITGVKLNANGSPIRTKWESLLDPKTGMVKKQYQMALPKDVNLNTQGLEALRGRALSTGPSQWANMMAQKQGLEQTQAADDLAQAQAGQRSQAMADLAERGGLSDQARERLAMQGMNTGMLGRQQVNRQGMLDRMNIGLQDEQQKLGILQNLPGQELAALQPQFQNQQNKMQAQQFNIGQSVGEFDKKRAADLAAYQEQLRAWGSGKAADAQAAASGGGGGKK